MRRENEMSRENEIISKKSTVGSAPAARVGSRSAPAAGKASSKPSRPRRPPGKLSYEPGAETGEEIPVPPPSVTIKKLTRVSNPGSLHVNLRKSPPAPGLDEEALSSVGASMSVVVEVESGAALAGSATADQLLALVEILNLSGEGTISIALEPLGNPPASAASWISVDLQGRFPVVRSDGSLKCVFPIGVTYEYLRAEPRKP